MICFVKRLDSLINKLNVLFKNFNLTQNRLLNSPINCVRLLKRLCHAENKAFDIWYAKLKFNFFLTRYNLFKQSLTRPCQFSPLDTRNLDGVWLNLNQYEIWWILNIESYFFHPSSFNKFQSEFIHWGKI
jgi:hypothetical protein